VPPKYKIVHSFPVDLQDAWEGHKDSLEGSQMAEKKRLPTHLTVTINVPHIESMSKAKLDINESTLIFEYPDLYYLDLNLRYKCDTNNGNAKFDKTRKSLTIKLPILGLTEDA
jgi:dynein assembly factor 2